jgi:hypothetical protein
MKHLLLSALLTFASTAAVSAATVLTNLPSAVLSNNLVKGTGGFIPSAIEYGFEFTVGGGDYLLDTITLSIGNHFGPVPLTVELYGSPAGPDTATYITDLTGPSQPANQLATYAPVLPTTLTDGSTYFLRLWVNGNASSYAIQRTATLATGDFLMGDLYTRNAGSSWGAGTHASETMVEITATPVPEPAAVVLGCTGFLLILRRRRW